MLLQALVACAGVTLKAVATALNLDVRDAFIRAEGDLDFRGTLGVDKTVPVGFRTIRLDIKVDGTLNEDQLSSLINLTKRYCVIYQTLKSGPPLTITTRRH